MLPHQHQRITSRRTYHLQKQVESQPELTKKSGLQVVIVKVNIIRPIASCVFGKNHNTAHRLLAGTVVMAAGVMIAKYVGHSPNEIIAHLGDGVGYGLHGIGLIPFIESIAEKFE
jgi:hypothetical protein